MNRITSLRIPIHMLRIDCDRWRFLYGINKMTKIEYAEQIINSYTQSPSKLDHDAIILDCSAATV